MGRHGKEPPGSVLNVPGVPKGAQSGVVTRVVDGDTLHVSVPRDGRVHASSDVKVRLLEIDTPESVKPGVAPQCYSHEAAHALERLAPVGSTVFFVGDEDLLDPYGRTLLYMWNSAGRFVNYTAGAARVCQGGSVRHPMNATLT